MEIKKFFPGDDITDAHLVRDTVFITEQGFSYDADEHDAAAWHIVLYDEGTPVAAGRILKEGADCCHMGRICVLKHKRGGLGRELMNSLILFAEELGIGDEIVVQAQCRVTGFYEKCGFEICGETYPDEGVPHVPMIRKK